MADVEISKGSLTVLGELARSDEGGVERKEGFPRARRFLGAPEKTFEKKG